MLVDVSFHERERGTIFKPRARTDCKAPAMSCEAMPPWRARGGTSVWVKVITQPSRR